MTPPAANPPWLGAAIGAAGDIAYDLDLATDRLVLAGPWQRLFGPGTKPGALKLASSAVSTTGVVMSVYDRAGAIRTGSFELPQPSAAEIARRERMKREG